MSDVVEGEVIEQVTVEVSPVEEAALNDEQAALNLAVLNAQVTHLTARVAELARENARLKEGAK